MFLKPYNTEFEAIIITFTDQNGGPLEIKIKITLILHCLLINRNDVLFKLSNTMIFCTAKNEKIC